MKVFLCESIHPEALALLTSRVEIVSDWGRIGEVDAIFNRNLQLPRSVLEQALNLKVIAVHGTGADGLDLDYCNEHHIPVFNVPYQNSDSVAELIVGLTLALLRKIHLADRMILAGKPLTTAPPELFGHELAGKTLGLIGAGDIAGRVARIMKEGFRVRVVAYSPSLTDERAARMGAERAPSIQSVVEQADIICPIVPLNDSTRNLLNADLLAHAKPTAILVNASRGPVVNEEALYQAITQGKLAGAACDVWCQEPPTLDNPLVGLDQVIATPHLGANTEEALRRVGMRTVEQIFDVLDGRGAEYLLTSF